MQKNNGAELHDLAYTVLSLGSTFTVMMMVLYLNAGLLAFTPPGDEMSEVVSRCLPHRQLWVSNLSNVATQWLEVDSNLRPSGCKAQNIPLHHRIPLLLLYAK